MQSALSISIQREPWHDVFSVFIRTHPVDRALGEVDAVALPLVFTERTRADAGTAYPPALRLSAEDAQRFIDELWHAGLRPTEGSGSAGALAATQRHLEDFRHLVFKTKPKSA